MYGRTGLGMGEMHGEMWLPTYATNALDVVL